MLAARLLSTTQWVQVSSVWPAGPAPSPMTSSQGLRPKELALPSVKVCVTKSTFLEDPLSSKTLPLPWEGSGRDRLTKEGTWGGERAW